MTKNVNKTTKQKAMLEALEKTLGNVTQACKIVGITRQCHYVWTSENKQYAESVLDIENVTLDFAESQLHKQIKTGSVAATIFLLKTKGKKRGYIERQELTGAEGKDLGVWDIKIVDGSDTD
jgi:hypothetical protein